MAHKEKTPGLRFEEITTEEGPAQVVHVEGDALPTYEIIVETISDYIDVTVVGPMKLEDDGNIFHGEPSGTLELRAHGDFDQARLEAVAGDLALLLRKHLLPQQPPMTVPGEII
jgi:hypothetical protein